MSYFADDQNRRDSLQWAMDQLDVDEFARHCIVHNRGIIAMQPAAEKTGSKRVLIVDIDASTTPAVTFENLNRVLDELRYIKNKVFFTYMKDADEHFK